jgi:hypothetical protein
MPFLAALLLRVTIAGYEQIPTAAGSSLQRSLGIVAITSFGLGKFNSRFLTCNDFVISGNDAPLAAVRAAATWETVSAASGQQPMLMGIRSRGRARRHIQLGEDIAQMALHGLWA